MQQFTIKNVTTLRREAKKQPTLLNEQQKKGLKYHSKISKKISRAQAQKHVNFILSKLPGATISGSFRRKAASVRDIDILILKPISWATDKLQKCGYLVDSLNEGKGFFSGVVRLPNVGYTKIDIVSTTKKSKPFALLYFTGDYIQNINMRKKAKKLGYTLSQHGLLNLKTKKNVSGLSTERDIFAFLGMVYKPPAGRTHSAPKKKKI